MGDIGRAGPPSGLVYGAGLIHPSAALSDDWYALYHGGHGKVDAAIAALDPAHHVPLTCGIGAEQNVYLP
jgi:hypothetical protein